MHPPKLCHIEAYAHEYRLVCLFRLQRECLLTIVVLYDQQKDMLDKRTHQTEDRIVSLLQPWSRPIVKGESKTSTEFGALFSVSVVNGYTFIDRISFDAYNEGEASELEQVVEMYRRCFGHYLDCILADKIYRSRNNREFCKTHRIRLSGSKLGLSGKIHAEEIRQELQEIED